MAGKPVSLFHSKGGSSVARAQRARKGHANRRAKLFATSYTGRAHYKGSPNARTKRSWLGF